MNDGTKKFPANPTANTNSFGGCLRDYKNSPVPVVVRVSYVGGTLKVSVDTHSKGKKLVPCFEQKDLQLPIGYHFGFSVSASGIELRRCAFDARNSPLMNRVYRLLLSLIYCRFASKRRRQRQMAIQTTMISIHLRCMR